MPLPSVDAHPKRVPAKRVIVRELNVEIKAQRARKDPRIKPISTRPKTRAIEEVHDGINNEREKYHRKGANELTAPCRRVGLP